MFKILREKISRFAALHPRAMTYSIAVGATLGIGLAVSSVMSPHDALADSCCLAVAVTSIPQVTSKPLLFFCMSTRLS